MFCFQLKKAIKDHYESGTLSCRIFLVFPFKQKFVNFTARVIVLFLGQYLKCGMDDNLPMHTWGTPGAHLGHNLGHTWGTSRAHLGHKAHLGHTSGTTTWGTPRAHLGHISGTSRAHLGQNHLGNTSDTPRTHLGHISGTSRAHLGQNHLRHGHSGNMNYNWATNLNNK